MLFKERKSGNFKRSFVKIEASFGWFFIIKVLNARIRVSWSASTELTFSIPERSKEKGDGEGTEGGQRGEREKEEKKKKQQEKKKRETEQM